MNTDFANSVSVNQFLIFTLEFFKALLQIICFQNVQIFCDSDNMNSELMRLSHTTFSFFECLLKKAFSPERLW